MTPGVQAANVDLTWTTPTTSADGSPLTDLQGYRVYFATSVAPCPGASFREVASPTPTPTPGESFTYRLTGLAKGTSYSVQITALDTNGNESGCSNEATAVAKPDMFVGLGTGGGGWLETTTPTPPHGSGGWVRIPWGRYNSAVGETRPGFCDVDGDGKDELVIGLGPGGGGWLEVRDDADTGYAHLAWVRVPWGVYNQANGETFPACGDLDGDLRDEIVVGLGAGGKGWVKAFDDATAGYVALAGTPFAGGWLRLRWGAYNAALGEVHPAIGNLDLDAGPELVLGLGSFPTNGGWVQILDDRSSGFTPLAGTPVAEGWLRVPWGAYNGANGETRPVVCDLNGDGAGELVLGLGSFPTNGGWVQIRGDAARGFAPLAGTPTPGGWVRVPWSAYRSVNGETFPACGDADADGLDELLLGLGSHSADLAIPGGWLEIKQDLNSALAHGSWARVHWGTYNSANGLTRPAVAR